VLVTAGLSDRHNFMADASGVRPAEPGLTPAMSMYDYLCGALEVRRWRACSAAEVAAVAAGGRDAWPLGVHLVCIDESTNDPHTEALLASITTCCKWPRPPAASESAAAAGSCTVGSDGVPAAPPGSLLHDVVSMVSDPVMRVVGPGGWSAWSGMQEGRQRDRFRAYLAAGGQAWQIKPQATMQGHRADVTRIAAVPGLPWPCVITASADKTLRVWDLQAHRCIAELAGHVGCVSDVSVSGDGRTVISASYDKTMCLWSLTALMNL